MSVLVAVAISMSGVAALANEMPKEVQEKVGLKAKIQRFLGLKKDEQKAKTEVKIEEKKEEAKEEAKEKQEIKKVTAQEKKQQQIQRFWDKMEFRLGILIKNQEKLADRIEKKIIAMEASGKNTASITELKSKLAAARVLIASAKTALDDGSKTVKDLDTTDSKAVLKQVREINKDILEKIKAVHEALIGVIKSINDAKSSPTPTPTPSPTPTQS